ncbi:MAG: proprotein convertase P-domain-containing protein [Acidobacteria bacterium]|nr:proprotein convertase P-domain-containing protein [Acidobacteriota bacterium]
MFAGAGGVPLSAERAGLKPLAEVPAWTSPEVDVPGLLREDEANRSRHDIPYRIGHRMATDLSPASAGAWDTLDDGSRVWRLSVASRDALWIVLGFDRFRIPDGAQLWVYDPALTTVQTYTSRNVRPHGQLWTPPIEGSTIVIELAWPASLAAVSPDLHLAAVSHGYKPFGTIGRDAARERNGADGIGDSGACNIDVNCPLGALWQDQKRGVVILLSGGEGFCSASLINTTANDCRPYVLTAHHCGAGVSTVFGFNFERSGCNTGDPPPPSTYTVSGATVLADYSTTDFTLLQMDEDPPESFDVFYNGWNRSTVAAIETYNISHPSGDVKKMAYDDDPPTDGSYWGAHHWRIGEYEQGTTEGGSSGSPLFDQNHNIIGQLHGGEASCTNITWDEYGKVSVSWDGGGTTATRLSDWLDPNSTGQEFMDGVDAATCAFHPAGELRLDRDKYACADSLFITLRDDNLRGNPTQDVTLTSDTETTPETVTLTAIEPGSGTFTGSFPVATGPAAHGDGHLSVSPGDLVTALYIDADDGSGGVNIPVPATAVIDCSGPVISNVASQNVTGNSAEITWDTDELANSVVTYDTVIPPVANSTTNPAYGIDHLVRLAGLTPCTTYYYYVSSTDTAGNSATDTNGGAYYTFRTGTNVNPTYTYPGPAVPIPDNNPVGAEATISVPYFEYLVGLTVTVNITHTFDGDISLSLRAPNGTVVPLATRRGSSGDNYVNTVFDDAAPTPISSGSAPFTGSFRPESPLGVLAGLPSYGDWTLVVVDNAGSDSGTINDWSLTLFFPPAPCGAQVQFDADTYSCSSTGTITVKDTNVAGASLTVNVASSTEPGGETVVLTRLAAPQDTWFEGQVAFTAAAPASGDGLVSVADADTVTVTYIDADDGQGNIDVPVTDTAVTDCVRPVITNVGSSGVTGNSAIIGWNTNETATSVVHYGLARPPALTTQSDALVTGHAVPLTGLVPCSTYFYSVESVDPYGNATLDDNFGNYYLFTTLQNSAATFTSSDTPLAIPDNNSAGVTSTIAVADLDVITDLDVVVNITHTYDGDLSLTLIAPNGASIALATRRGSGGDNFVETVFDDAAATAIADGSAPFTGSYRPETPLSVVNGLVAAGNWQLKVVDNAGSDSGTLQDWSLRFAYVPRACGPSAEFQSFSATDSCAAGGPGGGNGAIDRGEDVTMPVTIRNNGTVTLTGLSATISTATPGVTITRATAAYADLPAGMAGTSLDPHFAFTVGLNVPCGSDIVFDLLIESNEGTFGSSFPVKVGASAVATVPYPSTDVPKPIADNSSVDSIVVVAESGPVVDVNVTVNITHTFDGDLSLSLVGPNGVSVALVTRRGSSGDNFVDTVFDDSAVTPISSGSAPFTGSFKPESPLAGFNGIPANGTWTLHVVDNAGGDTGTLTGWTLEITSGAGWTCTDCVFGSPAGEPENQAWAGKDGQTWDPVPGATSYYLYRGVAGDLPDLLTDATDSCLRLDTPDTFSGPVLTETPAAGGLYWYIVCAANSEGVGPAGDATDGPRVLNSSGACP